VKLFPDAKYLKINSLLCRQRPTKELEKDIISKDA
jgi:hypothetical protein